MNYDPQREIGNLENRIYRDFDRRFIELNKKLDEVSTQIEKLEKKFDGKFETITDRKRENYIWSIRIVVGGIIGTIIGLGATGFIEILRSLR